MDEATRASGPVVDEGGQRSPDEIRKDIERTREQLGETVEALAVQTDVKRRAREKAADVKGRAKTTPVVAVGAVLLAALAAGLILKRR